MYEDTLSGIKNKNSKPYNLEEPKELMKILGSIYKEYKKVVNKNTI